MSLPLPKQYEPPSGEFKDATLGALGHLCYRASFVLRDRKTRPPAKRKILAAKCADLFLRVAEKLYTDTWQAHSPESLYKLSGGLRNAYDEWLQKEYKHLRWIGINRAAAAALGDRGEAWLNQKHANNVRRSDAATFTDRGFFEILGLLEIERASGVLPRTRDRTDEAPAANKTAS